RLSSTKLVRKGRFGRVLRVENVGADAVRSVSGDERENGPTYNVGLKDRAMPRRLEFTYDSDARVVLAETAKDRGGRFLYRLQYFGESKERTKAEYIDAFGNDKWSRHGERVEYVREEPGYDVEKRYTLPDGSLVLNQQGIAIEKL